MKCPIAEKWDLLALELLEEDEARGMLAHARVCEECRVRIQAARREHVERMRMYEAFDRDHDEQREQLMAVLPHEAPPAVHEGWAGRARRRLGDFAMSMNQTKGRRAVALLAPAACIVIAVVVFLTPKQSVFAAALERMRQASTIVCDISMYMNESEEPMMNGTMFMSDEHGARVDLDLGVFGALHGLAGAGNESNGGGFTLLRGPDGPALMINPQMNIAVRMYGLDELGRDPQRTSPDEFIRQCLKLTGDADTSLGESTIDGRVVEGFEVGGERLMETIRENHGLLHNHISRRDDGETPFPDMTMRLWVDVETNLPVRIEVEMRIKPFGAGVRVVHAGFEWDVPLDAALFEVEIPEGMREIDLTIPPAGEETLIESLRLYSEHTGLYPNSLDPSDTSANMAFAVAAAVGREVSKAHGDSGLDQQAIHDQLLRDGLTMGMAFHFVQNLKDNGQAPEYFGDIVSPADEDELLMQWRLDDGRMRVIYGDLSAETVETTD